MIPGLPSIVMLSVTGLILLIYRLKGGVIGDKAFAVLLLLNVFCAGISVGRL